MSCPYHNLIFFKNVNGFYNDVFTIIKYMYAYVRREKIEKDKQIDKRTRLTDGQMDGHTNREREVDTDLQTHLHIDTPTNRHIEIPKKESKNKHRQTRILIDFRPLYWSFIGGQCIWQYNINVDLF